MSKSKAKQTCHVVGCLDRHTSLHRLPAREDIRAKWIHFIYNGNIPASVSKNLVVCANHFASDCFSNLGQYKAGLAMRLYVKDGSIPTVRGKDTDEGTATKSALAAVVHHVACQTDPPATRRVGTQLSMQTLQRNFKSTGSLESASRTGIGVRSSIVASSRPCKRARLELEEDEENLREGSSSMDIPDPLDPSSEEPITVFSESANVKLDSSGPVHKMAAYIVHERCLLELFAVCPECQQVTDVQRRSRGTFLSVKQQCTHCHFSRKWNSQPIIGDTPVGNLQLSAAVYTTGSSFFKLKKIFRAMQLKMFPYDTFRRHARMYIEPAIIHKWNTVQDGMLQHLSQHKNVILGGDLLLTPDSPGHPAKFGSYSMMDLRSNTIVDVQLVQSNEVGGSKHMEKEGLKRSLAVLEERGVTLQSIVTGCHPEIEKFLGEANITHYYDVWHMEKGLSKKLGKIAQKKECEKLSKWLCSIKNHLYLTAASSPFGPERVAKWTSILNHVQDIHTHEDPVFPQCLHPQHTSMDKSKWLTAGTPVFCRLEKVLTNERVLKDVQKLSPHYQTSSLEAFHNVILCFAPKNVFFPFLGMLCRLYLAALHFNENAGRLQATSAVEEGECTTEPDYVEELLDLIFDKVLPNPAAYLDEVLKIPIPQGLSTQFDRRDPQEVT
ncbi:uncharacterized protein LOC133474470 isoform X1 [Phyllopteryx taeniolatus]|uniref:uncharacterized protein LOC133474470 isoform X1 n=1 Tax=Phyllopteryx taeniolatus TaxID=161469 RepID=UPI002AD4904D|nr:uncharacterized protein LOC133474470 isoform X1 [Phyllopteryx taeniolatus]